MIYETRSAPIHVVGERTRTTNRRRNKISGKNTQRILRVLSLSLSSPTNRKPHKFPKGIEKIFVMNIFLPYVNI